MNEWERLRRQAERCKAAYPPGTRVMIIGTPHDAMPEEVAGLIAVARGEQPNEEFDYIMKM